MNRPICRATCKVRIAAYIVPDGQEFVADEAVALAVNEPVPVEPEANCRNVVEEAKLFRCRSSACPPVVFRMRR